MTNKQTNNSSTGMNLYVNGECRPIYTRRTNIFITEDDRTWTEVSFIAFSICLRDARYFSFLTFRNWIYFFTIWMYSPRYECLKGISLMEITFKRSFFDHSRDDVRRHKTLHSLSLLLFYYYIYLTLYSFACGLDVSLAIATISLHVSVYVYMQVDDRRFSWIIHTIWR